MLHNDVYVQIFYTKKTILEIVHFNVTMYHK